MEPEDFLSREEFEALTEAEQAAYVERLGPALDGVLNSDNAERRLTYTKHYVDVAEWTLSPEEYERMLGRRFWEAAWDNAETLLEIFEHALADPNLPRDDRVSLEVQAERTRLVVAHKRDLGELSE